MTEPGYVPPPQPGWWVRKDRIGTAQTVTDFETSTVGYKPTHYWQRKNQLPHGKVGPMALRNKFRWRPTRNPAIVFPTTLPIFSSIGAGAQALSTSLSFTHNIDATVKAVILYAIISNGTNSSAVPPAHTATFGGVSMSQLGAIYAYYDGTNFTWLVAYGLLNPPQGANTVTLAGVNTYITMNSVAYRYVSGWGPVTALPHGSWLGNPTSANPSITAGSPDSNRLTAGAIGGYTQAFSAVTPRERAISNYVSGQGLSLAIGDTDGPAGTVGVTGANQSWCALAVELEYATPTYSIPTWVGNGLGTTGPNGKQTPSWSWNETVPSEANCAVLWLSELPTAIPKTCTVTLGGTAMVEMTGSPWTSDFASNFNRMRGFYLLNPPTGPRTVAITMTTNNYIHAATVYYSGVTSVAPLQPSWGPASATPSITIPNSASDHLYAVGMTHRAQDNSGTYTAMSGATLRAVRQNYIGSTNPLAAGDAYGNGGSLAISGTRVNTGVPTMVAGVDLSPAALPTYSTPTWVGTGVGYEHFTGNASYTETVPANANCAILIIAVLANAAITVTLDGAAMTSLGSVGVAAGAYTLQAFYKLNPSTGASKTLSITNTNGNYATASMIYYGGVTSVTSAVTLANQTTVAPAISVSSATNHMYVNGLVTVASAAGDRVLTYDKTIRYQGRNEYYDLPMLTGDAAGTGSTLTFNATRSSSGNQWAGLILDLA